MDAAERFRPIARLPARSVEARRKLQRGPRFRDCEMQRFDGRRAGNLRELPWHWTCKARPRGSTMDLLFVVATIAFFVVSVLYVRGCDRL